MTEQEGQNRLDEALDALIAQGGQRTTGDPDLDALLRTASSLRGLPDPDFKERLRQELAPRPARGRWLGPVTARLSFARGLRGGRRAVAAAAALAAGVAVASAP